MTLRPLEGIKVVEVATYMFVPAAAGILAEWGADVVKVEHPVGGDPMRGWVRSGLASGGAAQVITVHNPNRSKRSVGVDIANPAGLEILYHLVEQADVFITNLLPQVRRQLSVDVDDVRARNPRIVYVRGSAHGPRGPESAKGGFDGTTYWFGGGFAQALTPPEADGPVQQRGGIGDAPSGAFLAGGVAAALLQRERTGHAPVVDVSLLNAATWTLAGDMLAAGLSGESAIPYTRREAPNPTTNTYRTSDDRWLSLAMMSHDFFPKLCEAAGRPDLAEDPRFVDGASRFEHRVACVAALDALFAERLLIEWGELLDGLGAYWAPLRTPREVFEHPQVAANGYFPEVAADGVTFRVAASPVQFDETTPELRPAPEHGQQTEEVLLELGYGWEEIAAFKERGAVV
jgi:crotonobetainyl-CoA:carnitine CoA-transferase CaiB-like acyl-CoA transferase